MILDKNRIYDGWDNLAAGMDAGRRPSLIDENQCAKARDSVFRGGVPKSRPGIRKLTLEFEEEIYYGSSGAQVGPAIIHDAFYINIDIDTAHLFSQTAMFTAEDIGSAVIGPHIIAGTTIANIITASHIELSREVTLDQEGVTVTIVGRTNPTTFVGNFSGHDIAAVAANFSSADVGHIITGAGLPDGTFITSVTNPQLATLSVVLTAGSNVTFTMLDRAPNKGSSTGAFSGEPFQCARYYSPQGLEECIVATLGGRLFKITPLATSAKVREIPLPYRNRRNIKENWMVQADRYFIVQDNESKPIIFDGVAARRATEGEVIVGQIMAYGLGRLVVTRGRQIFFGDLFGSHAGDPSDSILKFEETNFLSEGFPAEIPYTLGDVTAAAFYPQQDTSTGQGELIIFTDRGAVTFDLHLERSEWKKSTFQQIALINSTARGSRAVVTINGDLWIRSDEGWRAYRQARAQATGWQQLPMSTEVSPWILADTAELLRYGSAINFNNRLIVTCNPVPNTGRLYHDGLLVLDFDVLSSFGQATRPAWDGHWSKLKTLQLVSGTFSGKHRAFAFGLDEDNTTQLYEISMDDHEDFDGPITSEIEFRSHNFGSPFNEKNLYGADIWVDEITQPTTMELSFRPDSSSDYILWKSLSEVRPPGECGEITCGMCPTLGQGFAPRQKIAKPKDDCDDYSGRLIRRGFEFQPKLRWTGHAAIRRMRLHAMQEEEDSKATC